MWSKHGHKGSRFGLEFAHHGVYEATGWICPQVVKTSLFLGKTVFVSRVKEAGHWVLFANANKSHVKCPNAIAILSQASRLKASSSFSKDHFGKKGVARGLCATMQRDL